MNVLGWIAAGGAVGAMVRYLLSGWVYGWWGRGFPWGTLAVNVLGSFLMGFLFFLMTERVMVSQELRMGILTGGLGALTTFSTFSIETLNQIQEGEPLLALANVAVSVVLCLAAVWLGMWTSRLL